MKKNGFTLVEILAVVAIISTIALISVPSIINYINNSKNKISEVTQKLIFAGADLYIDNNDDLFNDKYQKTNCVILNKIVDDGYLQAPIIDSVSNQEINLNKFLKATLEYDEDLKKHKFNYEIVDECESQKFVCVGADTNEITTGNVPKGRFQPGDEYICEVKDGTKYNFFVLSTEDDKINLMMDSNITYDGKPIKSTALVESYSAAEWYKWHTSWISKEDIEEASKQPYDLDSPQNTAHGPITALKYTETATSSWDNIPNLNEKYTDKNGRYGPINLTGKARLPKEAEINGLFINKTYNMDNFRLDMLPIWATNYLYNNEKSLSFTSDLGSYVKGRTHVEHLGTYWLLDTYSTAAAHEVGYDSGKYGASYVATDHSDPSYVGGTPIRAAVGVRPVISLTRDDLKN